MPNRRTTSRLLDGARPRFLLGTHHPLPGCTRYKNCANCMRYALRWRAKVLAATAAPRADQLDLFDGTGWAA